MTRLILYSGSGGASEHPIYSLVSRQLTPEGSISFISSDSRNESQARKHFEIFLENYACHNIHRVTRFTVDRKDSAETFEAALNADAIYLSGGPTFYFLHHLRQIGALPRLSKYLDCGGLIIGASAGAIILSPSVRTATMPCVEDKNEVSMDNFTGLDRFPFLFLPHYDSAVVSDEDIKKLASDESRPVLGCPDGSAVMRNGTNFRFFGDISYFGP